MILESSFDWGLTQCCSLSRHLGARWGRLQPAADFSPPAAAFTGSAGGRAEARRRLKSAPQVGNQGWSGLLVQSQQHWGFTKTILTAVLGHAIEGEAQAFY